MANIDIYELNL